MTQPTTLLQRRPERTRLYLPVTFQRDNQIEEARLRDVSSSGALLETSIAPPVGTKVHVNFGETAIEGQVAWVDSTWFGVEFTQPVSDGVLDKRQEKNLKVSAPRGYRREVLDQQKDCAFSKQ